MERIVLTAPDVSCEHCKRTIEGELGAMTGVKSVSVAVPEKRVEVSFEPSEVSRDDIVARLEEEGYPISP